ncbi:MAG: outer membrane lipid asymmetry maintenance protein MlaD [Gammaproteobacteria bacterium]|nr:outer membrane lipid asymmetry maintenance protein MlaD [Gammaproteobacteria bacterium]
MNKTTILETGVGLFVVLGLAALFMLAMKMSNFATYSSKDGYTVTARFEEIGGLKVQAPVNAGGVRVGRVTGIDYDEKRYQAKVTMQIDGRYKAFPTDTTAAIYTAGLLGEKYIGLEPGGETEYLKNGSEIRLTQSALVMERVLGQFLFNKAQEKFPN